MAARTIGVLDLQGGVQEHLEHLQRVGIPGKPVKEASDFGDLAGLIIPGGESTCLKRLLTVFELKEAIEQAFRQGTKLWGTCAGAILLARDNIGEEPYFDLIDIVVKRNAFGAQLDSFNTEASVPAVSSDLIPLTFIRAPKIVQAGEGVRVLLRLDDYIAAAEDDDILVTVFHPELTASTAFHRYFARKCGLQVTDESHFNTVDSPWNQTSWMQAARKGRFRV